MARWFGFEQVAETCVAWNQTHAARGGSSCVGIVAGATDIPALAKVRRAFADGWILCPGVGAQGGEPQVIELAFSASQEPCARTQMPFGKPICHPWRLPALLAVRRANSASCVASLVSSCGSLYARRACDAMGAGYWCPSRGTFLKQPTRYI